MSRIRQSAQAGAPLDRDLFRAVADQGWLGVLGSEQHGGAAMDHMSLGVVLEELGKRLAPAPLLFPVLAARIIERAGSDDQRARFLPGLFAGQHLVSVALSEPGGSFEPDAVKTWARARGAEHALSGIKAHVAWGQSAAFVVAPARLESEDIALFVVPLDAPGVTVEAEIGIDPTRPMARITLENVHLGDEYRLAQGTLDEWRALHLVGAALLAAEMVGAAQSALTMTRDYANERTQFNRPLGSFQAVKHPLVDTLVALESARSLVCGALGAFDDDAGDMDRCRTLARMAKVAANQALARAVDRGVQLHGGFGFTWDCDMHFYYKRSLWSGATLGDAIHHRRHLAARLLR